jgi:aminotransferase
MSLELSRRVLDLPPSGIRKFFDLVVGAKDIISLGVGEPDFATPWTVRSEGVYAIEHGRTSYTSNLGLLACREAVSGYLKTRFSVSYDPAAEILLTIGVSEAVDIVLRTLLDPGDEVIVPEPSYVCYGPLVKMAGGTVVAMDTSDSGFIPTADTVASRVTSRTKALILCSPSNPTGRVIPRETLVALLDLAVREKFWIIADEVYAELVYDVTFTSVASLPGAKSHVILLNGFSKAFAMTGWRLGYLCAPAEVVAQANKIHQYSALCAPIMAQYAAIEAVKNGLQDLEMMRVSYEHRRNYVVTAFQEMGLSLHAPEGAFYCFPSIRETGLSSETFAMRLLEEKRVAVVPGSVFGLGGEGHIRCCYAADFDLLKEALSRIAAFVASL